MPSETVISVGLEVNSNGSVTTCDESTDSALGKAKVYESLSGTRHTTDAIVKSGVGYLSHIILGCTDAAPTAGTVSIYDGTDATGTLIDTITFTTTPFQHYQLNYKRNITTGIFLDFTTTADVSVYVGFA